MGAGWLLREYSTPLPRWEKNISFLLLAMQVSSACSELIGREKKPNNPPRLEGRAGVYRARAQAARADGTMRRLLQTLCLLLLLPSHHGAVITGVSAASAHWHSAFWVILWLFFFGNRAPVVLSTPMGRCCAASLALWSALVFDLCWVLLYVASSVQRGGLNLLP